MSTESTAFYRRAVGWVSHAVGLENHEVGSSELPARELRARTQQVFELFPILKERARQEAGELSGGEQQMVALARALVPRPKLLMLDEPSLGLSPGLVKAVLQKISEINHDTGVAILLVEQKVRQALAVCHRAYSLKLGRVAFGGDAEDLRTDTQRLKELFL